ncbi:MAG: Gfo/Idh/MocA family oxidoreductase [Verrucomicrobia bacterium]|nr:Gfo/Idh/MocA family oxidoreductase [Verrucomicrobiota bacterium]MCH8512883.1 Gfo/Idh/MocA family oxidoreductase [Kiritimatiellia bacterium]
MTNPPVQLAVIGCGNFARSQHLPNLRHLPEARLAAVCDTHAPTAQSAAQTFAAGYATTELRDILNDDNIEAAVVAVRDDLQADIATALLQSGKHVYVEKPGATRDADFQKLIQARDQSDRLAVVGMQKRFSPAYRAVKAAFEHSGAPRNIFSRMADDAWRWAKGYPPGALIRHDACHLFDLLRLFTGSEVKTLHCLDSRPDDDAILIGFENGATATLLHSGHASMDFPKERFEAITDRGGVIMDDFVEVRVLGHPQLPARQTFSLIDPRSGDPIPDVEGLDDFLRLRRQAWQDWTEKGGIPKVIPNFLRDQGWRESLREFCAAIRNGNPHPPHASLEDARAASRIATLAEESRTRLGR